MLHHQHFIFTIALFFTLTIGFAADPKSASQPAPPSEPLRVKFENVHLEIAQGRTGDGELRMIAEPGKQCGHFRLTAQTPTTTRLADFDLTVIRAIGQGVVLTAGGKRLLIAAPALQVIGGMYPVIDDAMSLDAATIAARLESADWTAEDVWHAFLCLKRSETAQVVALFQQNRLSDAQQVKLIEDLWVYQCDPAVAEALQKLSGDARESVATAARRALDQHAAIRAIAKPAASRPVVSAPSSPNAQTIARKVVGRWQADTGAIVEFSADGRILWFEHRRGGTIMQEINPENKVGYKISVDQRTGQPAVFALRDGGEKVFLLVQSIDDSTMTARYGPDAMLFPGALAQWKRVAEK